MTMKEWISDRENRIFVIFGVCIELILILFYLVEPLRKVIGDTGSLMPKSLGIFIVTVFILSLLFSFYYVAAREVEKNKKLKVKQILIFLLIFLLTLLFVHPIGSIDIFSYIYRGRIHAIHHLNPYFYVYNDLTSDTFYSYLNNRWSVYTTLYGPAFVIISSFVAYVGKSSVFASLFLMKGVLILFHFINAVIIGKLFKRASVALLYAWNPLLLFEFAVNGHNDVILITFLLLGLYVLLNKKASAVYLSLSFLFFFCAFLVKATAIVFLPLMFGFCFLIASSKSAKALFVSLSLVGSLALGVAVFFPFWEGIGTLLRPVIHSSHVYDTLFFASLFISVGAIPLNIFNLKEQIPLLIFVSKGLFIFSYTALCNYIFCRRKYLEKSDATKYLILGVFLFYLFFFTWLMPWYYTILITLLIIRFAQTGEKYLIWISHTTTVYAMFYYIFLR